MITKQRNIKEWLCLMTYHQRLPDPRLHKGHSNPSTEGNFCKGVYSMSSCHRHFGLLPFVYWSLLAMQSPIILKLPLLRKLDYRVLLHAVMLKVFPLQFCFQKVHWSWENLWFRLTHEALLYSCILKGLAGWLRE